MLSDLSFDLLIFFLCVYIIFSIVEGVFLLFDSNIAGIIVPFISETSSCDLSKRTVDGISTVFSKLDGLINV